MVVAIWLSVGYHFVMSGDQVESRPWWVAGGSSYTFVAESPDECARVVMVVTPQSLVSCFLSWLVFLLSSSLLSLSLSPCDVVLCVGVRVLSVVWSVVCVVVAVVVVVVCVRCCVAR